jgi:hypothetical protein
MKHNIYYGTFDIGEKLRNRVNSANGLWPALQSDTQACEAKLRSSFIFVRLSLLECISVEIPVIFCHFCLNHPF